MLSDHLGSTSLTTDANGAKVLELRYKAWGEVRATWTSSPSTTPAYKMPLYQYTGQAAYLDDPLTSGVTEGFGLMFYNARWYDPGINHFVQADTIVSDPLNSQSHDRYAYGYNNPLRFSDSTGHFNEDEIDRYLQSIGIDDPDERAKILKQWQQDEEWWKIISGATYGDTLDGSKLLLGSPSGTHISLTFHETGNDTISFYARENVLEIPNHSALTMNELFEYTLVDFYKETVDILWLDGQRDYKGGTGYAADGAKTRWDLVGKAAFDGFATYGLGMAAVGLLAAPEPVITKALAVGLGAGYIYGVSETWKDCRGFERSVSASYRLSLLQQ